MQQRAEIEDDRVVKEGLANEQGEPEEGSARVTVIATLASSRNGIDSRWRTAISPSEVTRPRSPDSKLA
jgi:hypothetical protein